ncbi:type II toxin-antitoxin system death-on-curing family toxin [Clostridium tagluense]|uniref:Death-on-curing protein n=1 Tax=Clostridium tagluense TaxID=360422 RepID=A0A401USV4_9CLOT|nr:type II toxin-antitoxin system death-on-curing family toxin [Clostridium tagluense]GCD12635.1 death-on-curing protein [Clostridium tagluense]
MKMFSEDKILQMHRDLINTYGGLHGIKNYNLFKSAIETPFQTFDGVELYKTGIDKISIITYLLIQSHSMNDGNKRIGVGLMLALCIKNNIKLQYTQEELIKLGLEVAKGWFSQEQIKGWIINHIE